MKSATTYILWFVYICLLLVLLPHTAWAFESMEAPGTRVTHWVAAIAFEAAIAVLTHKLAKHIETKAKVKGTLRRFAEWYLNSYSFGLVMATFVSALANLAHAVEFARPLVIFTEWGIPEGVYSVAFGAVLPLASLVFARVLSNVTETEDGPNPDLETAKQTIAALRKQVHELNAAEARAKAAEEKLQESEARRTTIEDLSHNLEHELRITEERARIAEERFGAAGDLMRRIFHDDKRERILAVHEWKPKLSGAAIALIADSSPAYVSEVLREVEVVDG